MKKLIFAAGLLASTFAFGFQPGEYNCGAGDTQYSYKIKSLELGGTALPYLEVTNTQDGKSHSIKGFATQFTNSDGYEVLVLGNVSLELKAGRPGCGTAN